MPGRHLDNCPPRYAIHSAVTKNNLNNQSAAPEGRRDHLESYMKKRTSQSSQYVHKKVPRAKRIRFPKLLLFAPRPVTGQQSFDLTPLPTEEEKPSRAAWELCSGRLWTES